jgi:hypothetical protein
MQENVIMKYAVKHRHTISYGVSEKIVRCRLFFQKLRKIEEIRLFLAKITRFFSKKAPDSSIFRSKTTNPNSTMTYVASKIIKI